MLDIYENRAPLGALALWALIFLLDAILEPLLSTAQTTLMYYLSVFVLTMGVLPLYLSLRWNVGEAGIFLGFSLILWSVGDFACSFFSVGSGGICFLLRQWYPSQFLIVIRLFAGSILVMYLVLNPDVGTEALALPAITRDEGSWFLKVLIVLVVLLAGAFVLYRSLSRADFRGEVVYVLTGTYRDLDQPELVYTGLVGKYLDERLGYVLVREQLNMTNLPIGRIEGVPWDANLLEDFLGLEVEILGKLSEFNPSQPRMLFPGRIRESQD